MPPSDSQRLNPLRADEESPTVVEPAPFAEVGGGSSAVKLARPASGEAEKTVISQRPPLGSGWSPSNSAAELGVLLLGKHLGHFTLEEFVGGGGMGAVFRGRDNLLGRTVAVKVLSRDQGSDPETLRRFKNEAQSAARLDHDNIARVFFVGEDEGWNFIVFEFIDGTNIRDLVDRGGPLSLELAIDFTIQIAEALAHAAERDVVHRDIKPSNILVTADNHAKLVDMGLARLHQMEAGESDLTASGVTLGTFDYISPEQASDPRRADVRSDLYSLGCTVFFMLTGRPPFPQGTVLQKLLAHSGEAPPDPRDDRPELPEAVTKIVHRLMAKRPDGRYRQPADLIGELLVLREQLGLAHFGADGTWLAERAPPAWHDYSLAWAAPFAMLLVLFAGLNVFWGGWNSPSHSLPEFRQPNRKLLPVVSPDRDREEVQATDNSGGNASAPTSTARRADEAISRDSQPAPNGSASQPPAIASAIPPIIAPEIKPASARASSSSDAETPARNGGASLAANDAVSLPENGAAPIHPIRLVVIGDASQLGDVGSTVAIYPSLGEALADPQVVAQLPQIQAIQIHSAVVNELAPLAFALPHDGELRIMGVPLPDGQLPKIRFTLPAASGEAADPSAMVQVSGGKLTCENIHWEFRVADREAGEKLALVRIVARAGAQLEMRHCVGSIDNSASADAPQVAFVDIQAADADVSAGVVPISLRNSIFRGKAVLVRLQESMGLDLDWNNGLFVSNSPLLETAGARRAFDESGDGTIRLHLDDVTIRTTSDLCVLRDSAAAPHQAALEFECDRCIFTVGGSIIKHDGVGDAKNYAAALHISGSHNFYEGVDVFWRAYVDDVETSSWDWLAWKKQLMRDEFPSYTGPIRWKRLRSEVLDVPFHLQGTDDYALDESASNPAVRDNAGFIVASLPPVVRRPPSASTSEAEAPQR